MGISQFPSACLYGETINPNGSFDFESNAWVAGTCWRVHRLYLESHDALGCLETETWNGINPSTLVFDISWAFGGEARRLKGIFTIG